MAFNLVRYSQQDPQWKNKVIGGGPDTIGYIGCAMTCVAMYSSGWGFTETPGTLNQKLTASGGYVDEAIVWGAISKYYPKIKSTGLTLCMNQRRPDIANKRFAGIRTTRYCRSRFFSRGRPANPLGAALRQSRQRLFNTRPLAVPIRYPRGNINVALQPGTTAAAHHQGGSLVSIQRQHSGACSNPASSTGGSTPTNPPTTTPIPAPVPVVTDLVIQVIATATAGIKLHTQASPDSIANYAELPGVPLNVIEAKAGAQAKIGQNGQWIYIQDPQGHQGFVAAWLVQQSAATTPSTPTPTPQPAPTPSTPTPSTPTPGTTDLVIQVVAAATAGIKLHTQASQDSISNYAEMPGVPLNVIEANAGALTKIGQNGQWIYIQDPQGHQGFVAAWLVQQSGTATPATPTPSTPTPSNAYSVYTHTACTDTRSNIGNTAAHRRTAAITGDGHQQRRLERTDRPAAALTGRQRGKR